MISLVVVTRDSERYIEPLFVQAESYADEIVVLVDEDSTDDTYGLCAKYADTIERVKLPGFPEPILPYAYSLCKQPYILRMDDDELLGERFVKNRDPILRIGADGYWFPRYQIIGKERDHYLSGEPWYPDYQLRLFKNGKVTAATDIHCTPVIKGRTEMLNTHIFHYKYVLKSREEREAMVRRYDAVRMGAGSGEPYHPHQIPEAYPWRPRKCEEQVV